MLRDWDDLPEFMKCEEVRAYYDILAKKKLDLWLKRAFDLTLSGLLLVILAFPMLVIAGMIKLDSKGPVFFRQERITAYGKKFSIHKFRTMVVHADKIGSAVTVDSDKRVTKIGARLRDIRLDELPQILDVLRGNMSFVGTRPEVTEYVKKYSNEMYATLLLPAGITSETSIRYKDEAKLLNTTDDVDKVYIQKILPAKMKYNLLSIRNFSFPREMVTMFRTVLVVFGKKYD